MEKMLLDLDKVAELVRLIGGNQSELDIMRDTLLEMGSGLADEFPSSGALSTLYIAGYINVAGTTPPTEALPSERQIMRTIEAHPGAAPLVARHFVALGAVNGIAAANPDLKEFAKLLMLFSLDQEIGELLTFIANGLGVFGDRYEGARSVITTGPTTT